MILSFHKEIKNRRNNIILISRNNIETDFSQRNPISRQNINTYANSQMQAIVDNYYDTSWSRMQGEAKKCANVLLYIEGEKK